MKKLAGLVLLLGSYALLFSWLQDANLMDALLSGGGGVGWGSLAGMMVFLLLRLVIFLILPPVVVGLLILHLGIRLRKR